MPLVALCTEFRERCSAIGISCVPWKSQYPPDKTSIVLVTPESVLTIAFRIFLVHQQTLRRLDRIVIDKCHLILNSSSTFRPDLAQLGRLQNLNIQIIFLTAILPPILEPHFWRRLRTKPENVCLLRDRTTRSNIAYRSFCPQIDLSIQSASQWLQDPMIIRLIQDRRRQAQSGRILVYISTISQTVSLAALLDCKTFYSKQIDKESILDRFRRTPNALLVATSTLDMDIDISDICMIIHIGWPWDLLDYIQETGRAGQNRYPSEAILIQPYIMTDPLFWIRIPETDSAEKEIVRQWLNPESLICRRILLDQYLDSCTCTQCQNREELYKIYISVQWFNLATPEPEPNPGLSLYKISPTTSHPRLSHQPPYQSPLIIYNNETVSSIYYPSSTLSLSLSRPDSIPEISKPETAISDTIPIEYRFAIRQQDLARTKYTQKRLRTRQTNTTDLTDFEAEIQQWIRRYWICTVNQYPDDHKLIHCTSIYSQTARTFYNQ
ncbi:hypothetical protein VI817_003596 [Penicillium citrinum]|nr:hypothetical protein VI817_003596 [Penicillium citrinum]